MATQYMGGGGFQYLGKPRKTSYATGLPGRGSAALAGGPASFATTLGQPTRGLPAPKTTPGGTAGLSGVVQALNDAAKPPAAPQNRYEGISYSADPILAQIRLLGQNAVPDAISGADAARKQLLVGFGDPALARSTVFGGKGFSLPGIAGGPDFTIADTTHTGDESSAVAAQQNPFSTLARLLTAHTQTQRDLDESLNQQNLYYSGYRSDQLGKEQKNYQGQQSDAYSALAQAFASIDSQLQAAYQAEGDRQMGAEQAAYLRALGTASTSPPAAAESGGGGGSQIPSLAPLPQAVYSQPSRPSPASTALSAIPILGALAQLAFPQPPRRKVYQSSPGGRGGV